VESELVVMFSSRIHIQALTWIFNDQDQIDFALPGKWLHDLAFAMPQIPVFGILQA